MLPSRYKILTGEFQAGGFGAVIPVEDSYLRRVVLLKTMHDASNNAQLQSEINGLCAARSRHVIEIYDVIKNNDNEVVGVIIERLRGRDFNEYWKNASSNPTEYLKILYQVAVALRDLHAVGIVHRDLKIDNFKESSAGIVKLYDFGISSPDNGYVTLQNKGTLVYAAPELYMPGAVITQEMDIYAFGICAWFLATNKLPSELYECPPQYSEKSPSIRSVMPSGLHDEIIDLIDRCISVDPSERPSAQEVSATFGRHLVRNKHRGLFVQGSSEVFELSSVQSNVTIKVGSLGELRVDYDGLIFKVKSVTGEVRINNSQIQVDSILPDSCLLAFGSRSLGPQQQWVTFFSSHPEVVL